LRQGFTTARHLFQFFLQAILFPDLAEQSAVFPRQSPRIEYPPGQDENKVKFAK
jgi:hypothetical protein